MKPVESDLFAGESGRAIFNAMSEGFALHEIILDKNNNPIDYRFLEVNPAFERYTGLSRETILGKTVREVLPEIESYWIETYGKVALTGEAVRFTSYSKELEKHFDVFTFSPVKGQFACLFVDVTDRVRWEEQLHRQQAILESVSRNTDAHLVYLDSDFNFVWVNRAYVEKCGHTEEELIGRNHFSFFPNPENEAIFTQVRDTGKPFSIREKPFVFAEHPEWGTTYWNWTLTPIKDPSGQVEGLVLSLADVTHDVVARQEIEELKTEAENRAREIVRAHAQLEEAYRREHHYAKLLQRALLPEKPLLKDACEADAVYVPIGTANEEDIGGDFYDIFETASGVIAVLVGDVSGKGIPAATLAVSARSTLHAFIHESSSPADALTRTNSVLYPQMRSEFDNSSFATAALAVLSPSTGRLRYAVAGHPPPLLLYSSGKIDQLAGGSPVLGIFSTWAFRENSIQMESGDKLILYTDGITEARYQDNLFDVEGIEQAIAGCGQLSVRDLAHRILSAATDWAHGHLTDDAAVVTIEFKARRA